jgi:hypothetical protein
VDKAVVQHICHERGLGCIFSESFFISKSQLDFYFPVPLLIPGLFGLDRFDMSYLAFLQLCLCAEKSLGLVSGKRNSSYYIAGFDAKHFGYFDPHTSQRAVFDEGDRTHVCNVLLYRDAGTVGCFDPLFFPSLKFR